MVSIGVFTQTDSFRKFWVEVKKIEFNETVITPFREFTPCTTTGHGDRIDIDPSLGRNPANRDRVIRPNAGNSRRQTGYGGPGGPGCCISDVGKQTILANQLAIGSSRRGSSDGVVGSDN